MLKNESRRYQLVVACSTTNHGAAMARPHETLSPLRLVLVLTRYRSRRA